MPKVQTSSSGLIELPSPVPEVLNQPSADGTEALAQVAPGCLRLAGELTLNGAAARKVAVGDVLILITYAWMGIEEAKSFNPALVFPNEENNLLK